MSSGAQLVKEALRLSEFVGRYTQLVRKGTRMAACCPLHQEKTPSFYVDDSKGYFHCFGCGKSGDIISFCQEAEGFEFIDALEYLAEIAGVELPKRGKAGPGREEVSQLREINGEAVLYYQKNLANHKKARQYLDERGISESTTRLFRLGMAPEQWDALYEELSNKYDPKLLLKTGLFKAGKTGKIYDLFRGRLIFPIRDAYGNSIAFGGRLIADEEGPKYINSPETPLYVKSKHVYNMDFAKVFLKKAPLEGVVVVEGYMDAIQLYQAGICNVIAALGTAFAAEQGKLLKRFTKKAILNYDGDEAGYKAARAAIEVFLQMDLDIAVISLQDKMDPDDYLKNKGVEAYREEVTNASGFFDYLINYLAQDQNLDADPRQRSLIAREMVGIMDRIGDPVLHEHYSRKLAEHLKLSPYVLDKIHESQRKKQSKPKKAVVAPRSVDPSQPDDHYYDTDGYQDHYGYDQMAEPQLANPFNKIEEEFLFHAMHTPDFTAAVAPEQRDILPKILAKVFADRRWVLDFLYSPSPENFQNRLEEVPDMYRSFVSAINFAEEYNETNHERLEQLCPDLLRAMLDKMAEINHQRMRVLPPEEQERKKVLMRQNTELMRQKAKL